MKDGVSPEISQLRKQLTRLGRRLRQEARNDPASWTHMLVISAIDRLRDEATPSTIARSEDMRSSHVAAVLRGLEASLIVERRPDETDRRVTRLVLTQYGEAILAESRYRRDAWLARVMAKKLTEEECKLLIEACRLLERLDVPEVDDVYHRTLSSDHV